MILDKDGSIVKTEFCVEGRKCPLREIRRRKLHDHEKYIRNTTDVDFMNMAFEEVEMKLKYLNELKEEEDFPIVKERLKQMERTRHLKVWHDLSTVANHSHLVFMVSCLYYPALFYTNQEYQEKTGETVDIQQEVEPPELYLIARSSSSDLEQLCYIDTRVECLLELAEKITTSYEIPTTDVMRFFHGDSPARQFECGQKKGGHYYCSVCSVSAKRVFELDYSFRCQYMSLAERQKLVLKGLVERRILLRSQTSHLV